MPSRRECANALRALAMDAVQKANSGHPGMPMGMADIAEVLWRDFLQFNPLNPYWFNRDRFILSNGHGAMLQYALLHLTGFDLTLKDLKHFRQLHSRTPGHPEYGDTPGIEATTGPLGQGLANGVGMAIAEAMLAAEFNREGFPVVDHRTYIFCGDGDLMEGISHEAASLAGTLGLGKLIVFYDDNGVSIDGPVKGWFTDNTPERFKAYHWQVIPNVNGHDSDDIQSALQCALDNPHQPTLICCKTIIAYGAPHLAGQAVTHGAPLGESEIEATRTELPWPHPPFTIPEAIYEAFDAREKGNAREQRWRKLFENYKKHHPELATEFERREQGIPPSDFCEKTHSLIHRMQSHGVNEATRKSSLKCISEIVRFIPELRGGSADLSESNGTLWKEARIFNKSDPLGRYIEFGVREFGMTAIANGMALHRGLVPYVGTFLVFSDYARNAVRLAAMMQTHVILIYTHDSIGLGEDGPTHQPIEQLPSLRMIPHLTVWRPSDGVETAVAWQQALIHKGPSCLVLTRQSVKHQSRTDDQILSITQGGYILRDADNVQVILIATGSEVELAVDAAKALESKKIGIRVVSMPSCEQFKKQGREYQEHVLPKHVKKRIAIEAAAPDYWRQWVGDEGLVIGIERFGASAPYKDAFHDYGFTVQHVISSIYSLIGGHYDL